MSRYTNQELEDMLTAVVDELNLSDAMIEKHGPLGTPVHVMVREVLDQKDLEITALKSGMKVIKTNKPT